jgi:hypothetical protein
MSSPLSARQVLDRHYLEIRARLLEVAACLDRIDRADSSDALQNDPRLALIREGIEILNTPDNDRAERIQLLFSDRYEPNWKR